MCATIISCAEKRIGYHIKCVKINLTHLCFADDLIFFAKADSPLLGELSIPGVDGEEDNAVETKYSGGVKFHSLSESISKDAWPIRGSDGVADDGGSEIDALDVLSNII
ncbi:hypothetical protein ACFE04_026389 [Oxalis oulophora]